MTDLVEESCYKCGVVFGMPRILNRTCRESKQSFFCPNGHSQAYVESTSEALRVKLQKQEQETERANQAVARERRWREEANAEKEHVERRLAAQKGVTTRLKNRVHNGVCPCCNRTFLNLQRHMASKHAGFVAEEVQAEAGQTIQ